MAVQYPDVRTTTDPHPLEPLRAEEISRVSAILREQRDLGPRVRFVSITLQEPPKREVLDGRADGAAPERAAFAVLYDRDASQAIEAVVSLSAGVVTSWRAVEGVQPSVMLEEFFATEEITIPA